MKQSFYFLLMLLFLISLSSLGTAQAYLANQVIDGGNPNGVNGDGDTGTTNWTTLIAGPQSSNVWSPVGSIPFSFSFFGTPVTHFRASQNGLVTFDTSATLLPNANRNLPTDSLPNMTIAAMWDEFTSSPPTGSGDNIYTSVYGTAPNRQLWIKWYSFEIGNPSLSFAYFACVLEETTNNIYIVDMYSTTTTTMTATVGVQFDNTTAVQFGDSLFADGGNGSGNSDNDYVEFRVSNPVDIAITDFLNFPAATLQNSPVNFDVVVSNLGTDPLSSATVDVYLNGTFSSSLSVGALNSGESDTLAASVTASASGRDSVVAALQTVSGDANTANDTLRAGYDVETPFATPYFQDFDALDPTITGAVPPGWANATDDDFDWDADNNGTTSSSTGPAADHTTGTTGNYMYTEATGPSSGDVANLTTPFLDLAGLSNPALKFWFHMYGAAMGELHVDVLSGGVWTNDVMPPLVGQYQTSETDPWLSANVDLSAYAGGMIKIRFRGIIGTSFTSDMAIDDVSIDNAQPDLGVSEFLNFPASTLPNSTVNFDVVVDNVGSSTAPSTTLDIFLNGSLNSSLAVASLNSGESDTLSASVTASSSGLDVVTAALQAVVGDGNLSNDTLSASYAIGVFFENFDAVSPGTNVPPGWTNETDDDIDWDAESSGTQNSTGTGPIMDHTTGSGIYMYVESSSPNFPNMVAHLTTPVIDLTGLTNPAMDFWFHMYGADMGELHVDVMSGGVWNLDAMPPLIGQYQTAETDPWLKAVVDLSPWLGGMVQIRFRGITGANFTSDMAIDDVLISEATYDVATTDVYQPTLLSKMPLSQTTLVSSISYMGDFQNLGPANTGDLNLVIEDSMGTNVFSDANTGVTLPGFITTTQAFAPWDASATSSNVYTISAYSSNFTDADASNDTATASIELSNAMAYDDGIYANTNIAVTGTDRNILGARFTLTDNDDLTGVEMLITGSPSPVDSFSIDLYTAVADTPGTMIARIFRGAYGDLGPRPVLARFVATPSVPLSAGDFFILIDSDSAAAPNNYPLGVSATSVGNPSTLPHRFLGSSPAFQGGDWLFFEDAGNTDFHSYTPIIRALFPGTPIPVHDLAAYDFSMPPCLSVDDNVMVSAKIINVGNQAETNVPVELREGSVTMSSTTVTLNPGESTTVNFSYTPSDTGIAWVEIAAMASPDANTANDAAGAYVRVAESGTQTVFTDDFEDPSFTFSNWIIVDDPTSTNTWMIFSPTYPNSYTLPITSRENVFSADADNAGSSSITITTAMLPLDLSTYDSLQLDFDNDWQALDDGDTARVNVSNDGGATWTTLIEWVGPNDIRNTHETLDLTSYLANSANAVIAFESIQPGFDWWWTIDNVCVSAKGAACTPGFLGDISGDDLVNSTDALAALTYDSGLPIPQSFLDRINIGFGDADENSTTNSTDALIVLSYDAGLSTPFPVGDPVCLPGGNKNSASTSGVVAPEKNKNVIVSAVPDAKQVTSGSTFDIPVMVNISKSGDLLGSYTATLNWDPNVYQFVGYSGGSTKGFENPVVNDKTVEEGRLTFAHAYPFGAEGRVNILNVRMKSISKTDADASLSLRFSAMAAAKTFTNLLLYVVNAENAVSDGKIAYGLSNYPNPFNPSTDIQYGLAEAGDVEILIYNVLGQKVKTLVDGRKDAGNYVVRWNGTNDYGQALPSGMYFLRMQAGQFRADRKLLFLK